MVLRQRMFADHLAVLAVRCRHRPQHDDDAHLHPASLHVDHATFTPPLNTSSSY